MNQLEPTLLTHLEQVRKKYIPEGGLSTVIFCGDVKNESETSNILQIHRTIVEEEVDVGEVNVTGLLIGQVILSTYCNIILLKSICF